MKTKDKLIKYFENQKLEVLDKDSKGTSDGSKYYTAVSLDYLYEHLFNKKITKKFIANKIMELCNERFLLPIPCNFADNLVFCNYKISIGKFWYKFTVKNNQVVISSYYKGGKFEKYTKNFNQLINTNNYEN